MRLVTSEDVDRPVTKGDMVYACAISGANILRDVREAVINTIGGYMTKYEALLDATIARALDTLAFAGGSHQTDLKTICALFRRHANPRTSTQ